MKKFIEEFKAFALRGNVMDMAVGVIIGGAFSGIVTALTDNFINLCPFCRSEIPMEASRCAYCTSVLPEEEE